MQTKKLENDAFTAKYIEELRPFTVFCKSLQLIAGILSQNDHLPYRGSEITFFNFEREDTNQNVGVQRV